MTEKKKTKKAIATKSGYVAIIGKPNVGKSTLLNYLIGTKIAGVSNKPQTTRGVVRGILTTEQGQIMLLDTPGMYQARDLLGSWMVSEIEKTIKDADLIYWMVVPEAMTPMEKKILELLKKTDVPVFLLVNQVDKYAKPHILPVLSEYQEQYLFKEFIPISAKMGDQIDVLLDLTFQHLPEGPMLFPEDQISDQNERDIVSEIIREKLYHFTKDEIPYSTAVMIDEFKDREDGIAQIQATIVVEKDSQKAIVIGKAGEMAKKIGQTAREDMEKLLGRKVFLKLWVKTYPDWKSNKRVLRDLGYQ